MPVAVEVVEGEVEMFGRGGRGPAGGGEGRMDATDAVLRIVLVEEFELRAPAVLSVRMSSSSLAWGMLEIEVF